MTLKYYQYTTLYIDVAPLLLYCPLRWFKRLHF